MYSICGYNKENYEECILRDILACKVMLSLQEVKLSP
jgi:hypothetical protein